MSYRSTITLPKSFGKDFDLKLKEWKLFVELDTVKERKLCKNLSQTDNTLQEETLQAELNKYKSSMHSGFQFVADNVDFIVKVRHIFLFVLIGLKSHRHSIGHIATFQLYWWRNTSDALSCFISGTNGHLSKNHRRSVS
jgi:hypothetical protein